MIQFVEFNGRSRAAFIMALLLSIAASCTRIEIVPRPVTESGAITFAPSIVTRGWTSISPASDSTTGTGSVPAVSSGYSLAELRDEQGRQRLYLHTFARTGGSNCMAGSNGTHLPGTRGAVVDKDNFGTEYGSFGVTAYAYRGKWADGGARTLYISDKQASGKNGTYDFNPSVF